MFSSARLLPAALIAAFIAFAGAAFEPAAANKKHSTGNKADTQVYLMRGLFGIYSLGMDDLAEKLKRDGYRAEVHPWDSWEQLTDRILRNYGQGQNEIVVIGHSLGANSVFLVSERLQQRGIPVLMGVTFDATDPKPVPLNVSVFINFWARDGFGHPVEAPANYIGELDNFDLSGQPDVDHTSIDALARFHSFVIDKLDKLVSR
jgi:hypothetical protein